MRRIDKCKRDRTNPKDNQDTSIQVLCGRTSPFVLVQRKSKNLHAMNDKNTNDSINFPLIYIAVINTAAQINSKSELHSENAGFKFHTRMEVCRGNPQCVQVSAGFVIKIGHNCSFQIHHS